MTSTSPLGACALVGSGFVALLLIGASALGCSGGADEDEATGADDTSEDALSKCGRAPEWSLHMHEDFDAWDDTRWTRAPDGLVPPNTKTCYLASNVTVSGSALRIATRNESKCGGQPYTGG